MTSTNRVKDTMVLIAILNRGVHDSLAGVLRVVVNYMLVHSPTMAEL